MGDYCFRGVVDKGSIGSANKHYSARLLTQFCTSEVHGIWKDIPIKIALKIFIGLIMARMSPECICYLLTIVEQRVLGCYFLFL